MWPRDGYWQTFHAQVRVHWWVNPLCTKLNSNRAFVFSQNQNYQNRFSSQEKSIPLPLGISVTFIFIPAKVNFFFGKNGKNWWKRQKFFKLIFLPASEIYLISGQRRAPEMQFPHGQNASFNFFPTTSTQRKFENSRIESLHSRLFWEILKSIRY